jgi:hypothetical protein
LICYLCDAGHSFVIVFKAVAEQLWMMGDGWEERDKR